MSKPIEDYALIGDCQSAALVAKDGSIDWLCWPRFDSGACFAALLGTSDHGHWSIAPSTPVRRISRQYRPGTLVLETQLETNEGTAVLTDFMPTGGRKGSDLVRIVQCSAGQVALRHELILRFDYGSTIPWVTHAGNGIHAIAGPERVVLSSSVPLRGEGFKTVGDFKLQVGQSASFVLTHSASHEPAAWPVDPTRALATTESFWRQWSTRCSYSGEWEEAVMRSLLTLKALTFAPTGGIVAAPTTSLPEHLGGTRNWDYRYCWLRDATLTLLALLDAGYLEEARAWRDWLLRAASGHPANAQIMYGIAGERRLPELELSWLPGYAGSRPVRVGNAAAPQLQNDVYGEVMDAFHQARHAGLSSSTAGWALQRALVGQLESTWGEPDEGIWEVRGGRQHFTHSKVMAWVALDRSIRSAEEFGLEGPVARWRKLRAEVHDDVCARGFDPKLGYFVQAYGSKNLDASLLLMPLVGFLPAHDERVRRTVEAIGRNLSSEGLIFRYRSEETNDGLPAGEGTFLACSFWYADNLLLQGREHEARELFERLLGLRNDVGLLAEQYDPIARRQLGNFPQAFSHLTLIGTALNLSRGKRPVEQRQASDGPSPRREATHAR
jgi:GH15 family glucan-1,4-alpha-glucosidase